MELENYLSLQNAYNDIKRPPTLNDNRFDYLCVYVKDVLKVGGSLYLNVIGSFEGKMACIVDPNIQVGCTIVLSDVVLYQSLYVQCLCVVNRNIVAIYPFNGENRIVYSAMKLKELASAPVNQSLAQPTPEAPQLPFREPLTIHPNPLKRPPSMISNSESTSKLSRIQHSSNRNTKLEASNANASTDKSSSQLNNLVNAEKEMSTIQDNQNASNSEFEIDDFDLSAFDEDIPEAVPGTLETASHPSLNIEIDDFLDNDDWINDVF
jgi:hypothetical protein